MAFDDDFVEVVGLGGVQGPQREVIHDEEVHARDAAVRSWRRASAAAPMFRARLVLFTNSSALGTTASVAEPVISSTSAD